MERVRLYKKLNRYIDNYNKFAVLELEDQRKAIKTKHREALEEIRRK